MWKPTWVWKPVSVRLRKDQSAALILFWVGQMLSVKNSANGLNLDSRVEVFIFTRGEETYQNSASECLSGDHDTCPVFDWSHPSHLAGRGLLLLISTLWSVCCLIVGGVVHLLSLLEEKIIICVRKWSISKNKKQKNRNMAYFWDKENLQGRIKRHKL